MLEPYFCEATHHWGAKLSGCTLQIVSGRWRKGALFMVAWDQTQQASVGWNIFCLLVCVLSEMLMHVLSATGATTGNESTLSGQSSPRPHRSSRPLSAVFQNIHPPNIWRHRKGTLSFTQVLLQHRLYLSPSRAFFSLNIPLPMFFCWEGDRVWRGFD